MVGGDYRIKIRVGGSYVAEPQDRRMKKSVKRGLARCS